VFHAELHGCHINFDVTADGGNQIISKRFELGRSQIRPVMDENKLQALLGAIRTVFPSEEFIEERHIYFLPANF